MRTDSCSRIAPSCRFFESCFWLLLRSRNCGRAIGQSREYFGLTQQMSQTYESAKRLVDEGEFGELRRLAEPLLNQAAALEPRLLVQVAHALVYTGEGHRALSLL